MKVMKRGLVLLFCVFSIFFLQCKGSSTDKYVIQLIQTAENTNDRLTIQKPLFFSKVNQTSTNKITINPNFKFQSIIGFGGAFTDSSSVVFTSLSKQSQNEILELYWGKNGIRYNLGRVPMNSCDFSLYSYNFDNVTDDYDLIHFDHNVTHDQRTMIPFMKRAMQTLGSWSNSSDLWFFLSPWSPPGWMKVPVNGTQTMAGSASPNGLLEIYYQSWALYFSYFISAYKNNGINFWGATPQNEPLWNAYPGEACLWTSQAMAAFIAEFLGPQLAADHPGVKILGFDFNREYVFDYMKELYSVPKSRKYISGTAFHWYDYPYYYALNQTHHLDPEKFILGTEATNRPGTNMSQEWQRAEAYGHDIIADLNFWSSGWVDWNILLDPEGGPTHTHNWCDACIIGFPNNGSYIVKPCYYYLGQITKYVPRGSVRIATNIQLKLPSPGKAALREQSNVVMWSCVNSAQQYWKLTGSSIAVQNTTYCLEVMNSNPNNSANADVYTCGNNEINQQWQIKGNSIVSAMNGKCLDILDGSTEDGANVQLYTCDSSRAGQQFSINADGTITSSSTGLCLTAGWSPIQAVSLQRPDNKTVTIVINETDEQIPFDLVYGELSASTAIPPHAIQTYLFNTADS